MFFSSYSLQKSQERLEDIAKKKGVRVEDLVHLSDVELSESDREYIQLLEETHQIVANIDAYVASGNANQDQAIGV